LIDLHLGQWNGFDLIRNGLEAGCKKPLILLTGAGEREIDQQAMQLGAADYLVKGQFNAQMLERAIRYAIRHAQTLLELRRSEERAREVLESQTELICRFQVDTTLTFVNTAYAHYFGKSPQELIGKKWLTLIPEDQHADVLTHVRGIASGNDSVTYEHEAIAQDGEVRWQQWTDKPIFDVEGKLIELQSVGIDITERKEAELTLRQALEKERELGELKSRFVSMASHEFRTPLTTILSTASFLEMAESQISSSKRVARLQKIQTAANEMTELLNDVLLFGKAEANRLEYHPKPLDIVAFTSEIIEDIRAASGKAHRFNYINNMTSPVVTLDDKLMRQVITNLVSNAVKYSPAGSDIRFELYCERDVLNIIVCDQGIGIPAKDQIHLFEPFHRAKNVRDISGTGLGLAITKKAVELHSGEITFESKANQGTCFQVQIPQS
ncbi:MAG: ATP-binding protein, partial [Chloroflexota bacterium]